jgi:hypothetical protein
MSLSHLEVQALVWCMQRCTSLNLLTMVCMHVISPLTLLALGGQYTGGSCVAGMVAHPLRTRIAHS